MPLPFDAHYVNSSRKSEGIRLADGSIVSRGIGENMGAQQLGYKNEHDYRARKSEGDRYVNAVLNGRQGQRDLNKARETARRQGKRFDEREYRKVILALRNTDRDASYAPRDRSPGSAIDRFHKMTGGTDTAGWLRFISGEGSP
jgi:hypothetical protein